MRLFYLNRTDLVRIAGCWIITTRANDRRLEVVS